MRLIGKRVERQNKFGDDYCIEVLENGKLKLSPALISILGVNATSNRIGFAYPDKEGEKLYIYKSPDKDGVAVNKQGYVVNLPHWRDLKSHFNVTEEGEKLNISSQETIIDDFLDYRFFEVSQDKEWKYVDKIGPGVKITSTAEPVTEDETYSEQEAKIQEELPAHSTDQYDEEEIPEAVVQEQEDEEVQQAYYDIEQGKVQKNIVNNEVEHVEAPGEPTGDSMDIF
jgi:hypothetical protein